MQISCKVIADSISASGKRITTLQLTMPRFILSQFNKHRAFSNNAASSRAIPVNKLIQEVRDNPVIPVYWGQNQAGMVAEVEVTAEAAEQAKSVWLQAAKAAADFAQKLDEACIHKQVANRILEPFLWSHVVVTSTEWENFFNLRLEYDSQPEMQELARCMKSAMDSSTPVERYEHLPYLLEHELESDDLSFSDKYMISAARCARVSYKNHDGSVADMEKDFKLATRLLESKHMTCFEHQAYALSDAKQGSNNFRGWFQVRKELES